jgi:lysozyme family protein
MRSAVIWVLGLTRITVKNNAGDLCVSLGMANASRTFEIALQFVLDHEGELANHPYDRGGLTYRGIARNAWPNWEGWKYIDRGESPPLELVRKFYYDNFWVPLKCDSLPPPIAIFLFDSAVGSGHSIPTRWLQKAIGASPDGIVGNETIQKAQKASPQAVVDSMLRQRMLLYANIVRHDRRQKVFLYGWLRRTMNLVDLVYRHYLREV